VVRIRPIEPRDRETADALLRAAEGAGLSPGRSREIIDLTLGSGGREYRAVVADADGELVGVAAFGELLGSDRVMRLHLLALRAPKHHEVGVRLLAAVDDAAKAAEARFIFTEMPDEPALSHTREALASAGYSEQARIADYVRDGVALVLLRRPL